MKNNNMARFALTSLLLVSLAACGADDAALGEDPGSDSQSGAGSDAGSDSEFSPDHDSDGIGVSDSDATDPALGGDAGESAEDDASATPDDRDSTDGDDGGTRGSGIPSECTRGLAREQICDGIADCDDATDERNCRGFLCPTTVNWIPVSQVCDGLEHCTGGGDETEEICANVNTCADGAGRYFDWDRCDLSAKCADGTDELDCESWVCPDTTDPIVADQLCDETLDCSTGADELVNECFPSFTCNSGAEIPLSQRCDGTSDCLEGEDETGCGRYLCGNGGTIPAANVCDGTPHCENGIDEDPARCSDTFTCADGVTTILGQQRCDRIADCPDGADDETECESYLCASGATIAYSQVCDDVRDCADGDDELVARCADPFACEDSGEVIESYARCDGSGDCEDGSDEINCTFFVCSPRERIPFDLRCDGNVDCEGEEDESSCEDR